MKRYFFNCAQGNGQCEQDSMDNENLGEITLSHRCFNEEIDLLIFFQDCITIKMLLQRSEEEQESAMGEHITRVNHESGKFILLPIELLF